jgi:hypothetical protein
LHDVDLIRMEQHFFVRLAQGRDESILARIDAAAGEGDLAGVSPEVLAPDCQDHTRVRPIGNRDENRSLRVGFASKLGEVADQGR